MKKRTYTIDEVKAKKIYTGCSKCGKRSRLVDMTVYVTKDGVSVGIPDIMAHKCSKCKALVIVPTEMDKIKELASTTFEQVKVKEAETRDLIETEMSK